ncbi:hypothetical protein ACWFRM_00170 [Streptomyces sp. NPDC055144]
MLLVLPYLAMSSMFALIRLLPMSNMDKDIEILTQWSNPEQLHDLQRSENGSALKHGKLATTQPLPPTPRTIGRRDRTGGGTAAR